jgi:hypothetical protein
MLIGQEKERIRNAIVISDLHCGCQLGLCPPEVKFDSGGGYTQTALQQKLWNWWMEFWEDWVPAVTKGEPYVIIVNGDAIDGVHHRSVTQISHNINDQIKIAYDTLKPRIDYHMCKGYLHVRGTEAHVGSSGQYEEMLAQRLGAIPDSVGNYARWEIWLQMSKALVHVTHHIGSTSSAAYESTAPYKELVEAYNEAGRWNDKPPDCVVRSHRHRQMEIRIPTENGYGITCVTPAWQLKTPFTYKLGLGRTSTPQIGGYLVRCGAEEHIYTRFKVWRIERPESEII